MAVRVGGKMQKDAMNHYARFTNVTGTLFRLETRVYLQENLQEAQSKEGGVCVAAIVAKNPGSASYLELDKWTCVDLRTDQMLRVVKNRFRDGYKLAGKNAPCGAFISVWNLFYLVDPILKTALASIGQIGSEVPLCPSEKDLPKIVWFAWGDSHPELNPRKSRFQGMNVEHPFFYDETTRKVIERVPSEKDFARHTQGMPKEPVNEHLRSIL